MNMLYVGKDLHKEKMHGTMINGKGNLGEAIVEFLILYQ